MINSKQITSKRLTTRTSAIGLAVVLVLAACGGFTADDAAFEATTAAAATTTVAPRTDAGGDAADEAAPSEFGSGGIAQPARTQVPAGRDIIFTATLQVSVDDVAAAGTAATRIVEERGGFVFGQQATGDPEPTTVLVFKIAPERFQETLAALGGVGEIRSQNVSADDVTDRIVDLESRIATAATSVARLRTLLEEADAIKTITELENQLLARETQLEQMRGSLRTLQNQVALATITMSITQAAARPGVSVQATAYLGGDDPGAACPGDPGIDVLEGETITYCLDILNVGDTALTEIDVKDVVLDRELADFVVVFGDLSEPLLPGQSVVLATTLELERSLRPQTRVTATPIAEDGTPLEGRTVTNISTASLVASDPGGIPGFTEGLERSWEVLINLFKVLILAAGLLLPFVWVLILGWFYMRWRKQRLAAKQAAVQAMPAPRVPVAPGGEKIVEADSEEEWDLEDDV